MELKDMTLEQLEARAAELVNQVETCEDPEEIAKATEEMRSINERKAELTALEQRKAFAAEIDAGAKVKTVEERKEEKTMDAKEIRNSKEYIDAFVDYIKTGDDAECRSLLSENATSGTVAVPDYVYNFVKTAWDKNDIMSLVRKVSVAGNLKVQFEISGSDAVIHDEGSGAVSEETLSLGIITMVPESIKKWISVSDEVLDLRGTDFLDYIYDELTTKIIKKAADQLIGKIAALTTADATHVSAATIKVAPALGTIAQAIANLSDEATNPVIVMNKLTYATFKAAQYAGNFNVDIFEGLDVRFNSSLPAYSTASENDVYAIVGDFGFGALANFPNGESVNIKIDDRSSMKSDLVDILGREYIAAEPVACKAFTLISKPATI